MPIYAYRCSSCGFEKDVLQKISDDPLTACPECHQESFTKQLTAPGFHPPPCQGGSGTCPTSSCS